MKIVNRKPARYTSYTYRYSSNSTKELREVRKLQFMLKLLAQKLKHEDSELIRGKIKTAIIAGMIQYRLLTTFLCPDRICRRFRRVHAARKITSFSESECWHRFRTRKEDLYRLLRAFKLSDDENEYIIADNGCRFIKEEILLIGLHRYCVPGPLMQTMGHIFHMDITMLSRAITLFNTLPLACSPTPCRLDTSSIIVEKNLDFRVLP